VTTTGTSPETGKAALWHDSQVPDAAKPPSSCPFCQRLALRDGVLAEDEHAVAFTDAFPVSDGHSLIVPRRHVASLFDLSSEEMAAVWNLLPVLKQRLDARHAPAGYNVGVNVGEAAGQTVGHAHVHLIPRFPGDVADPRGGVRWVIPEKAAYWGKGGHGK
jgi:diadenosine tetraphosphate (Ap4A) HIT family hydrolase